MKKLLKALSVLELLIGILCIAVAIAGLVMGDIIEGAAELPIEQQAVTVVKVAAVLGLISGVFNLGCGLCGLKGAGGDKAKLSMAVKLGWIGLLAAVVSGVLMLVGDATVERICSAVCSIIVPVLFLVSAKGTKDLQADI